MPIDLGRQQLRTNPCEPAVSGETGPPRSATQVETSEQPEPRPHTRRERGIEAVGFLTVVEHTEHGLFGGYLVLNPAGRPLEFHCTTPIRPSRAQQILYGPTLRPFLHGEQIGRTLLEKARKPVAAVLVDQRDTLALSEHVDTPVLLLTGDDSGGGAHHEGLVDLAVGDQCLRIEPDCANDAHTIAEQLAVWARRVDLHEPFERIRQAIEEARKSSQ